MKRESETTTGKKAVRPKRRMSRFHVAVALFIAILAVSAALAVVIIATTRPDTPADQTQNTVLGVKAVEVVGETRYSREAIAGVSGIRVGQSIFSVNKRQAAENIKNTFPYIQSVEVSNSSLDVIQIEVKESAAMGAIYNNGQWVVVGEDGRGLEALPVESSRPPRYLYFKGITPLSDQLGRQMLDERTLDIIGELTSAFEAAGLDGVGVIDLTSKADIRLNWKNQITMLLGNDSNLTYEIWVAVSALPNILEQHGQTATGVMDIRLYSDASVSNPMVIFKPTADGEPEEEPTSSETGGTSSGTTAAAGQAAQ